MITKEKAHNTFRKCYICKIERKPNIIFYRIAPTFLNNDNTTISVFEYDSGHQIEMLGITFCENCFKRLAGDEYMFDTTETDVHYIEAYKHINEDIKK